MVRIMDEVTLEGKVLMVGWDVVVQGVLIPQLLYFWFRHCYCLSLLQWLRVLGDNVDTKWCVWCEQQQQYLYKNHPPTHTVYHISVSQIGDVQINGNPSA